MPELSPLAKKLALIALLFVATVGCLLYLVSEQMEIMSAGRAYVAGEGSWSKGQKDAVIHLTRYAASADERDWELFRNAIDVPLGDRVARIELEKPVPDRDVLQRALSRGRNDPRDHERLAMLFRRFRHVSYMDEAIQIWAQAERDVLRLRRLGDELRATVRSGRSTPRATPEILEKIDRVNRRITPFEHAFSTTLGEGAQQIHRLLLLVLSVAAALLLAIAVGLSWVVLRQVWEGEERYRDLVENASDLIYSYDCDGNITAFNAAAERTTGYARSDACRMNIAQLVVPTHLEPARAAMVGDLAHAPWGIYELEMVARDGRRMHLEVSPRLILDAGQPVGVQCIARDLTERKRAEEARVSEALARVGQEIISALETPVLAERLCQLTMEVLGCTGSTVLLRHAVEEAYATVATCGAAPAASGVAPESLSSAFGDDGGDVLEIAPEQGPALLSMALRRGKEVLGVLLAGGPGPQAFSPEQRRIARGIAHLASMALTNARLVAEIEDASRLKSEFVSTMSHELRTPIHVILGYVEMAREPRGGMEVGEYLVRIEAAAQDLAELVGGTLEIARLDSGRDAPQLVRVDLSTFWASVREGCERLPRPPAVCLVWAQTVPHVCLVTDARKLKMIVRNLVGNALKFTERGWVKVDLHVETDTVVVTVADSGVGVRREDQAVIFEMFRQADGSETRRFGGSGLGLYIVRRFVEQLGGTIALESAPGRGSVFTVTLPRREGAPAATRAA